MPDEKGISKRQHYNKVLEQSGVLVPELADEVKPEFHDEPLFNTFFEIFQKDQEFYQVIYYYQKVMGMEFDGEDLRILLVLWKTASKFISDKEQKKRNKAKNTKTKAPRR